MLVEKFVFDKEITDVTKKAEIKHIYQITDITLPKALKAKSEPFKTLPSLQPAVAKPTPSQTSEQNSHETLVRQPRATKADLAKLAGTRRVRE